MNRWYDVRITAVCSVAVKAQSEAEAMDAALDEVNMGAFDMVDTEAKIAENPSSLRRHANLVLDD